MDIFMLIDELEQEIETGKKVPLSSKFVMEKERILDYIDKIRSELPEEMRQARWVVRERERVINEAKMEAQEVLDNTKNKITRLAQESEVVREAKIQSEEIIAEAHKVAYEIKSGANQYADNLLASIEIKLQQTLATIEEGRSELKERLPKKDINDIENAG
ncbi:MAG: hypothetical protein APF76_05125 [Desulfitibacter sp. BRH_c19]|nr:MAG: hypothetical protein APF76_05125 [Desulfitibacter sp. BRH_c19]